MSQRTQAVPLLKLEKSRETDSTSLWSWQPCQHLSLGLVKMISDLWHQKSRRINVYCLIKLVVFYYSNHAKNIIQWSKGFHGSDFPDTVWTTQWASGTKQYHTWHPPDSLQYLQLLAKWSHHIFNREEIQQQFPSFQGINHALRTGFLQFTFFLQLFHSTGMIWSIDSLSIFLLCR